jgi:hypothetical protein
MIDVAGTAGATRALACRGGSDRHASLRSAVAHPALVPLGFGCECSHSEPSPSPVERASADTHGHALSGAEMVSPRRRPCPPPIDRRTAEEGARASTRRSDAVLPGQPHSQWLHGTAATARTGRKIRKDHLAVQTEPRAQGRSAPGTGFLRMIVAPAWHMLLVRVS